MTIYLGAASPLPSSGQPERRPGQPFALLFALAPDGVCQATVLPRCWCALTAPFQLFSRRPKGAAGEFSFLWHFPSGRPAQPLAGILPCGVRTFLTQALAKARPRRGHPAHSRRLSIQHRLANGHNCLGYNCPGGGPWALGSAYPLRPPRVIWQRLMVPTCDDQNRYSISY